MAGLLCWSHGPWLRAKQERFTCIPQLYHGQGGTFAHVLRFSARLPRNPTQMVQLHWLEQVPMDNGSFGWIQYCFWLQWTRGSRVSAHAHFAPCRLLVLRSLVFDRQIVVCPGKYVASRCGAFVWPYGMVVCNSSEHWNITKEKQLWFGAPKRFGKRCDSCKESLHTSMLIGGRATCCALAGD